MQQQMLQRQFTRYVVWFSLRFESFCVSLCGFAVGSGEAERFGIVRAGGVPALIAVAKRAVGRDVDESELPLASLVCLFKLSCVYDFLIGPAGSTCSGTARGG